MARACQCDICGDLYTPYGDRNGKPNALSMVYRNFLNDVVTSVEFFDCCPACMATLQETINMLGDNKDEKN